MKGLERTFHLAGPIALVALAVWAAIQLGLDEGALAAVDGIFAFLIPTLWGAVGLAIYSEASRRLANLSDVALILLPGAAAAGLGFILFGGRAGLVPTMLGLGAVLGLFLFMQTPDLPAGQVRNQVLEWINPGVILLYTAMLTGFGLLVVVL